MFGEFEQQDYETSLLSAMSGQLHLCRCPGEAGAVIAHFAGQLFPAVPGALYLRRADDGFFALAASWNGFPALSGDSAFSAYECWALRRGRIFCNTDSHSGVVCDHFGQGEAEKPNPPPSFFCLPLLTFQGDVFGVLHLRCRARAEQAAPSYRTASTFRMAMIMADYVASALAI